MSVEPSKLDHEIEVAGCSTTNSAKEEKKSVAPIAKSTIKKTTVAESKTYDEYFSAVRSVEKERIQYQLADSEMDRYLSFLKATKLERELGLTSEEIMDIRKKVLAQTPITEMPVFSVSLDEAIEENEVEIY